MMSVFSRLKTIIEADLHEWLDEKKRKIRLRFSITICANVNKKSSGCGSCLSASMR